MTKDLLEKASGSMENLDVLRRLAIKVGDHELASECIKLKKELYPLTQREKKLMERAMECHVLFRLVELDVNVETCMLIDQALCGLNNLGDKFSIRDATEIQSMVKDIFNKHK